MEETSVVQNIDTRVKLRAKRRLIPHSQSKLFNEDRLHLLQIFPTEAWHVIISKLRKNPDDLESISNCSPFFHNFMVSQKNAILFKKVLRLVTPIVWKSEGLQGLPVKVILKCRQVCSEWNYAVDKLIPREIQYFEQGAEGRIGKAFKSVQRNKFTNLDENIEENTANNFLHHFRRTHSTYDSNGRNPFIWGTLLVEIKYDENEEDFNQYLDDISSVLHKYGSHLVNLSFHIKSYRVFVDISRLRDWLMHTPNLKDLRINGNWRNDEYQNDNPFPKLQILKTLHTDELPVDMFNQLIQQNSQISTLTMKRWNEDYNFFTFPLQNLQTLQIMYCSDEIIEKFGSPQVQWPLKYLTIKFHDEGGFGGCAAFFQVIQAKFASTLEFLDLTLEANEGDEDTFDDDCQNCRLDLKQVKFTMCHGDQIFLDFLLPMRNNLEEISVTVGYDYHKTSTCYGVDLSLTSGLIVQFLGFEGKMLDANIWAIFKKLKKVELKAYWNKGLLESRFYLREDWLRNSLYN